MLLADCTYVTIELGTSCHLSVCLIVCSSSVTDVLWLNSAGRLLSWY